MVVFNDLRLLKKADRLSGKAHHQDCSDGEVGSDNGFPVFLERPGLPLLQLVALNARCADDHGYVAGQTELHGLLHRRRCGEIHYDIGLSFPKRLGQVSKNGQPVLGTTGGIYASHQLQVRSSPHCLADLTPHLAVGSVYEYSHTSILLYSHSRTFAICFLLSCIATKKRETLPRAPA